MLEHLNGTMEAPLAPSPKRAKSHEPDEARDCLICLEPFAQSGEHQVSCLRCGHLFGHSCIVKWLKAKRWCPACQGQAKEKDVRKLFVATITAQDETATRKVEQELSREVRRRQSAERRLVEKDVELQTLRQQMTLRAAAASASAQPLRPLVDAGNCAAAPPRACPTAAAASSEFALRHALELSGARVVRLCGGGGGAFGEATSVLVSCAMPAGSARGELTHGVLRAALDDLDDPRGRGRVLTAMHAAPVRDFAIEPAAAAAARARVLSTAFDRRLRVGDGDGREIASFALAAPGWSCAFIREHVVAAGLADGAVALFDLRASGRADPLARVAHARSRMPLHSLELVDDLVVGASCGGVFAHALPAVLGGADALHGDGDRGEPGATHAFELGAWPCCESLGAIAASKPSTTGAVARFVLSTRDRADAPARHALVRLDRQADACGAPAARVVGDAGGHQSRRVLSRSCAWLDAEEERASGARGGPRYRIAAGDEESMAPWVWELREDAPGAAISQRLRPHATPILATAHLRRPSGEDLLAAVSESRLSIYHSRPSS